MTDKEQVTIFTAMSTEAVVHILEKIEDGLIDIKCHYSGDEQTRTAKIDALLDFVQDLSFDIEKGVNSK